jgi:hypothetical protein
MFSFDSFVPYLTLVANLTEPVSFMSAPSARQHYLPSTSGKDSGSLCRRELRCQAARPANINASDAPNPSPSSVPQLERKASSKCTVMTVPLVPKAMPSKSSQFALTQWRRAVRPIWFLYRPRRAECGLSLTKVLFYAISYGWRPTRQTDEPPVVTSLLNRD